MEKNTEKTFFDSEQFLEWLEEMLSITFFLPTSLTAGSKKFIQEIYRPVDTSKQKHFKISYELDHFG